MTRAALVSGLILALAASERKPAADDQKGPSVQAQLDELKRGQEQILRELQALRAALEQRPASARGETTARPAPPVVLNVHGEPFKGAQGAKLAIVEYSDFDCSHCAQFAAEIFPQIDQKYIATGLVKFFFRDLPEPGSTESLLKARAARCAGEHGRFWEMHDYLFTAKPRLLGADLSNEAQIAGVTTEELKQCLKNEQSAAMIQRSALGASRIGIRGTPTCFIGTLSDQGDVIRIKEMVTGVETFAKFDGILSDLLKPESTAAEK